MESFRIPESAKGIVSRGLKVSAALVSMISSNVESQVVKGGYQSLNPPVAKSIEDSEIGALHEEITYMLKTESDPEKIKILKELDRIVREKYMHVHDWVEASGKNIWQLTDVYQGGLAETNNTEKAIGGSDKWAVPRPKVLDLEENKGLVEKLPYYVDKDYMSREVSKESSWRIHTNAQYVVDLLNNGEIGEARQQMRWAIEGVEDIKKAID